MTSKSTIIVFVILSMAFGAAGGYALAREHSTPKSTMYGRVVSVTSGDQFHFRSRFGEDFQVELAQVDAPRGKGILSNQSRESLHAIAAGNPVTLTVHEQNGNSLVADVMLGNRDLAQTQVRRGWASVVPSLFGHANPVLVSVEGLAKQETLGIWRR